MKKIILIGLICLFASVLNVSAAELSDVYGSGSGGINTSNTLSNTTGSSGHSDIQPGAIERVRESSQNRSSKVLTGDDVEKAAAYQGLIRVVKANMNVAEESINMLRRQIKPALKSDIEKIRDRLDASERALDELAAQARYSVDRIQEEDLRERLFELRLSLELLTRRLGVGAAVAPFGTDYFRNVNAAEGTEPKSVPFNYTLRALDKILIVSTSRLGAQREYREQIGVDGTISIPGIGNIKASGLTLAQLSNIANRKIKAKFPQLTMEFTLDSVSPIMVQVAGSVVRPGTYTMSGLASVMSALYRSGGPSANGTMRGIVLSRAGAEKKYIDLYKFLMDGSRDQDYSLRDGDLIFVPPVGKSITVDGEVVRPARYEPKFPMTLDQALNMAGRVKASGYVQQINVERIENGEYRVLLNTPISDGAALKFQVMPGDQITVTSVRPERTNVVTISGPVSVPGAYQYKEGMKVSDLVRMAQDIDPNQEAYSGRADILRMDERTGTSLVSFDLGKALKNDPENDIALKRLDRVFIYLPDQVVFRNNRVRISGAVSNPGVYDRRDGMKISDAIAATGGVLPEAFLARADLLRYKADGAQELIVVDLESALAKNVNSDLTLADRDELMVYTNEEVGWKDSRVRIEGSVQRPGTYKRLDNMRISDLIFASGGLLPEAEPLAEIGRVGATDKVQLAKINLKDLVAGSDQDILLSDRDTVTIAAVNAIMRVPEIVYLSGEVANPGPYALSSGTEKLVDLIQRAGGLTPRADVNGLILMRKKEGFDNQQQRKDVQTILESILLYADRQFIAQLSQMGVKLSDSFYTRTQQTVSDLARPLGASDVRQQEDGIVHKYETNDSVAAEAIQNRKDANATDPEFGQSVNEDKSANLNKNTADIKIGSKVETAEEAGNRLNAPPVGPERALGNRVARLSQAEPSGLAAVANAEDLLQLARISVDFKQALAKPTSPDNVAMRAGDRIHVPQQTDTVTVLGAVLHPHVFSAGPDKGVDYYIERSGGYAQDAAKSSTIVVHSNGDAIPAKKVRNVVPGDIVIIPNTGLIDITKKWEKIGSVTSVISDILSSVFVLTRF